ncbi:hypothetical protein RND71_010373 [Anisodus tanguticus]|uniref:Response regulatory domain-containing protein n=1 Tax=Anisodus tanguticus TaxID=243964 RepID=A0AAE1VI37_9SOLA|nr:hypothetical protein RND71_010373 [Anisodus tanguticus]
MHDCEVTPVYSAADALYALNSQGPCVDIVLAEASLLISNGAKIFNFIKLDINLKHIPVISKLFFIFFFLPEEVEITYKHFMKPNVSLFLFVSDSAAVVMLDEDEIPLVLKGLMLGATDYFVKPLSSNELMKLWTHMKRKNSQLVY